MKVRKNQDGLKLNGALHLSVYADDVNVLGRSVLTIIKNAAAIGHVVTSKETGLKVNAD